MYKGKKYNAIIILLIFIISAVVGVSAGMTSNIGPIDNSTAEEVPEIKQDAELPTGVKPPSSSARPMSRIAFAIDIMNNGKGYKSRTNQTLTVESLGVQQSMNFEKHSGGGLSLAEEWYRPPGGLLSSFGKSEYKSVFSDGTKMHEKIVEDSSKYNFESRQVDYSATGNFKTFLVSDYVGTQNRMPLNDFFFPLDENEKAAPEENIKSPKTPGKSYYKIIVDINVGAIPSRYLSAFAANGGGNTKIKEITLTFYISKSTGMLIKVEKDELFATSYPGLGSHDCRTKLTETFYAMNSSQENVIKDRVNKSYDFNI